MWEFQLSETFSTSRIYTQRLVIGHAFPLSASTLVMIRVDAGTAADTTAKGVYTIDGPLFSVGIRDQTTTADFLVEAGFRVIPNWIGPNDKDPTTINLALNASLASGDGDDARWLPFAKFAAQLYVIFQSRSKPVRLRRTDVVFGYGYGGHVSLAPPQVQSWLGPEEGIVGNLYIEAFADILPASTQLGLHGDSSLTSIWPGSIALPSGGNVFIGWSPASWFSLRGFFGIAGAFALQGGGAPLSYPYGVRGTFYLP